MSYQISPLELKQKKERGEPFLLLGELDPEQEIITVCHHGVRSLTALGILVKNGFTNVKNLTGGIDAYSVTADPSIPRYR